MHDMHPIVCPFFSFNEILLCVLSFSVESTITDVNDKCSLRVPQLLFHQKSTSITFGHGFNQVLVIGLLL